MANSTTVTVTALPPQGMITLRGDFTDPDFAATLTEATGCPVPDQRGIVAAGDISIGWMSPDELLILCTHSDADTLVAKLAAALAGHHALAVNVSDARAVFDLNGPRSREVLAKLAPVDLAPSVFKPGELRRSRLAQVAAAFWMMDEQSFRIVCFRSVGQYVNDLLTKSSSDSAVVDYF